MYIVRLICIVPDDELNWIELNWIELNWTELNWIELNWIEEKLYT